MQFKKRSLIIAGAIFLTVPCYDIVKTIYKEGVKDGKANVVNTVIIKKQVTK
ncbi:hypothetical protein [Mucilaginibacter sp. L196]|uniref:hypothetical protein n=1 Tax=Mucilaginibacter sp. L196 TaxID=1641870 RepID=UPI00131BAC1B|nr:hypothetical protein [Mucilaginibacter sp. L196]